MTDSLPAAPRKSLTDIFLFGRIKIPPSLMSTSSSVPGLMPNRLRTLDGITTRPLSSTVVVTLMVSHSGKVHLPHKASADVFQRSTRQLTFDFETRRGGLPADITGIHFENPFGGGPRRARLPPGPEPAVKWGKDPLRHDSRAAKEDVEVRPPARGGPTFKAWLANVVRGLHNTGAHYLRMGFLCDEVCYIPPSGSPR